MSILYNRAQTVFLGFYYLPLYKGQDKNCKNNKKPQGNNKNQIKRLLHELKVISIIIPQKKVKAKNTQKKAITKINDQFLANTKQFSSQCNLFEFSAARELISKLQVKYLIYMSDTCNIIYNCFMNQVTLGFWRVRGRGQIPRLLLSYTGTKFEDRQYKDRKEWFEGDKQSLNLDFPNLPYLIDGDLRMTESRAINYYIIERSKKGQELLGKDLKEKARIYNVTEVIFDMLHEIERIVCNPQVKTNREEIWKQRISPKMKRLATFRGNREWVFDRITYADFLLAELSYFVEEVYPNEYKNLQFLHTQRQRFEKIPEIKSYYERPDAVRRVRDVEKEKSSTKV